MLIVVAFLDVFVVVVVVCVCVPFVRGGPGGGAEVLGVRAVAGDVAAV